MISPYWSWALCVIGVLGHVFTGRRRWWGWLIVALNEALYIAYGVATEQYGFVAGGIAYGAIYFWNLRQWWRAQRAHAGVRDIRST